MNPNTTEPAAAARTPRGRRSSALLLGLLALACLSSTAHAAGKTQIIPARIPDEFRSEINYPPHGSPPEEAATFRMAVSQRLFEIEAELEELELFLRAGQSAMSAGGKTTARGNAKLSRDEAKESAEKLRALAFKLADIGSIVKNAPK